MKAPKVWLLTKIEDLEKVLNAYSSTSIQDQSQLMRTIESRGEDLLHVISIVHSENTFSKPMDEVQNFFEKYRALIKGLRLEIRSGTTLYVGLRDYVDNGMTQSDLPQLAKAKEKKSVSAKKGARTSVKNRQDSAKQRQKIIQDLVIAGIENAWRSSEVRVFADYILKLTKVDSKVTRKTIQNDLRELYPGREFKKI